MKFQPAGSTRSRRRTATRRRLLVVVIVLVVASGAAILFIRHKPATQPAAKAVAPPAGYGVKQASDVNLVAGAIGQYAAANNVLPKRLSVASDGGLVMCGQTCDPTGNEITGLSVFQASDVKLVHYSAGLSVPNQYEMYLVPGAKCGSDGQIGAVNTDPRSMVIIYKSVTTAGTTPECVVL